MIMLSIKDACVTLRLTFLGGTDSIYRTRVCSGYNYLSESRDGLGRKDGAKEILGMT